MKNNGRAAAQIIGVVLVALITISGWVYATTKADAARRVGAVELRADKHEERLNINEQGLAVIEVQLKEINKKLDKLLDQE